MIEPMSVVRKNSLQNVAGSWNMNIPTTTAPTAPMPVHTGYAVPNGIVCLALARSTALSTYSKANAAIQVHHSVPVTPLAFPKLYVNPTSHSPATIKIIQFIFSHSFKNIMFFLNSSINVSLSYLFCSFII